jgi:hypothetical protein
MKIPAVIFHNTRFPQRTLLQKALILFLVPLALFCSFHPQPANARDENRITPAHVYSVVSYANLMLDQLLMEKGIEDYVAPRLKENEVRPMHVYKMAIACLDTVIEYEKDLGMRPIPKIVATPVVYVPADVYKLADILLFEIVKISRTYNIDAIPSSQSKARPKITPADVFAGFLEVFVKLNALFGKTVITPNDVYPQMTLIVSDIKSILAQIDPARRYRIDAPSPRLERINPEDVFHLCIDIRKDINGLRDHFGMETIALPHIHEIDVQLHPADVFVQTQIIIAELNILKLGTGTVSVTPIPKAVSGKKPADVYRQALMAKYLLSQIVELQDMTETLSNLTTATPEKE